MLKLVLLTLAGASMALGSTSGLSNKQAPVEERDAKILVQLASSTRGRTRESVLNEQNSLLKTISNTVTSNFEVTNRTTNVSNVIMMEVPASYVDDIRSLTGVKDVDYDTLHAVEYDDGTQPLMVPVHDEQTDNASAETMNKPSGTKEGEGVLVAVLDNSFKLTHEAFTALDNSTGVKLTQGDVNQIVATHPELHAKQSGSYTLYHNSKVPFYYDYGGSTNVRGEAGVPDNDVLAEDSHGTHVASTVGANGPYKGIAPNAQLALMKVFTDYTPTAADAAEGYAASSGAYDSSVLMAIEDAALIGADIISMSFGSDLNDFDTDAIVYKVINELAEEGIFSNIAAGNSGKGLFDRTSGQYWSTETVETGILGSYANTSGATVVAAGQPNWQFYETALLVSGVNVSYEDQVTNYNSTSGEVVYEPERFLSDLTKNGQSEFGWLKIPGWGEPDDYEGKAVSGKIAIVDRGETSFESKVRAAVDKGAIAVGIINNDASETDFTFRMDFGGYNPPVPVFSILFRDKTTFDTAGSGNLTVLVNTLADNPSAKKIASFTSDGTKYNLEMKPDITTPGQNIRGAVNGEDNSTYEYYSGTSMATPNYSGAQALMLSEHLDDPTFRDSLVTRTMSTATLITDELNQNHISTKFQGAGMMDIAKALDTDVYLEGVDGENNGINAAKIQLFNNEDIAKGDVKLSFLAHNESTTAVTYTAKTYIYAPALIEYDAELYPTLTGQKFMDIDLKLLETASETITVQPGSHLTTLQTHTISKNSKAYLDENFEYGTTLEGFVVLTPSETSIASLNIPFLGFYGDYSEAPVVEPFSFEKEPGKKYNSDMVNAFAKQVGKDNADYGSGWVAGYWEDMEDIDITPMILNDTNIFKLKDGKLNTVVSAGTDPNTGIINPDKISFGNNGFTNTMVIQQYVNRSVSTNTVTLTHKATGEVVLVDHMFDSLYGEDGVYSLFKSHPCSDWLGNGIIAHRAYTIIPFYDIDTGVLYPDGEYEMKFSYQLTADGSTQEMSYNFTLDSEAPSISSVDEVKKGGKNYIRIRYQSTNMSYAAINGTRYELSQDENGQYVDVLKSDYTKAKQTVYVKTYNMAHGFGLFMTNAYDETYHLGITGEGLEMSNVLSYVVTDSTKTGKAVNREFEITVKKGLKKLTFEEGLEVTVKLTEGFDPTTLEVFDVDAEGNETAITDVTINGIYATFRVTSSLKFRMTSDEVANPPAVIEIASAKGGCGGSIVSLSVLSMSISITLLAFVIIKRKKELVK